MRNFSVLLALLVVISGCKKDPETPKETAGRLLSAGTDKGNSWIFTYGISVEGTKPLQRFTFDTCILDNLYIFSQGQTQGYKASEGTSKCVLTDPDIVEEGTWVLSEDGQSITIYSHANGGHGGALFTYFGNPFEGKIITLTNQDLVLRMFTTAPNSDGVQTPFTFTFSFTKIQ